MASTAAAQTCPTPLPGAATASEAADLAHGRGYVSATPAAVWLALQEPEVVSDRHNTDRHDASRLAKVHGKPLP